MARRLDNARARMNLTWALAKFSWVQSGEPKREKKWRKPLFFWLGSRPKVRFFRSEPRGHIRFTLIPPPRGGSMNLMVRLGRVTA